MVCWYKCCPVVFRKNKPKRLQFKWDIVAMLLLTIHDIVALGLVIAASVTYNSYQSYQHAPYKTVDAPILVAAQVTSNFIIIFLMIEYGFRLLEDGPWYGKVTIGLLHVVPSIAYIAVVQKNFIYYLGFKGIHDKTPEPPNGGAFTIADVFGDVYNISVFHHLYVVLFESILTLCMVIFCSKKKVHPETVANIEDLPPYEEVVVGGVTVRVQLDAESRIFTPGKEIKGRLTFSKDHPPSATIDIVGVGEVSWTQSRCCKSGIPRKGVETVFNYTVVTSDMFQTTLPTNAPPTFSCGEGTKASISYCITATLNMNDGSPNFTINLPFIVLPSQVATSPFPLEHTVFTEKLFLANYLGCIPYKVGPYGFALELKKSNFIIGEDIDFTVEIFNETRRPVLKVAASLVSVVDLVDSTHGYQFEDELLMVWDELVYGPMPVKGIVAWTGKLTVPKMAPESASLPFSNAIEFANYYFRFLVEIQGMSENAELEVPICIGEGPVEGHAWLERHSQSVIAGIEGQDKVTLATDG